MGRHDCGHKKCKLTTKPFNPTFHVESSHMFWLTELSSKLIDVSILHWCWQVVPDLEKFMESMNQKMATIYENIKVLENPANPPPMERYTLKL